MTIFEIVLCEFRQSFDPPEPSSREFRGPAASWSRWGMAGLSLAEGPPLSGRCARCGGGAARGGVAWLILACSFLLALALCGWHLLAKQRRPGFPL
jgi:hypothetical protein